MGKPNASSEKQRESTSVGILEDDTTREKAVLKEELSGV